jgi:hypothetical protein
MNRTLSHIERKSIEEIVGGLVAGDSETASIDAGRKLVSQAKLHNLGLRDYLELAIDPRKSDDKSFADAGLSGYDAAKAFLGLPTRDDYKAGIMLEAASETFQTFPGVRALFPEVMDDIVRWKHRQDQFEQIAPLISNSRTISGNELITTVVNDDEDDYKVTAAIAEGTRIPIYSIRAGENSVKMFKHGMGYRTTYEFNRRARLDLITPYANRALRAAERSKVAAATSLLVNGDSVHGAAPVVKQVTLNSGHTAGEIDESALLQWLVDRAKASFPIDTVVGNWDTYVKWLKLFGVKDANNGDVKADQLARQGFQIGGVPILQGRVNFVISSTAPAGKLIGYSQGDTLEELVEANALISESEQSITNQTITYVRTETTGYRLVFGDTRSIYDFAATS